MSSQGRQDRLATNGRLVAWVAFVALITALNYAGRIAGGDPPDDLLYTWGAVALSLFQFGVTLAVVLAIARPQWRELLALRRPRSWPRAAGIAVLMFLAVLAVSAALEPFLDPGEEQGLLPDGWDPDRADAFVANFLVITTFVPIVEELMFRGLGFSLLRRFGRWTAILLVGLTFALAHGLVTGLVPLFTVGVGLAYLRERTDSVYPCILVHGTFNAIALIGAVAV